jgi:hypothetical protein
LSNAFLCRCQEFLGFLILLRLGAAVESLQHVIARHVDVAARHLLLSVRENATECDDQALACGGDLVGYWLPTKFAGPTNLALALIDFPSLAAYEQYRERLAKDDDNIDSVRRAEESGCILVEDRAFLERV